MPDSEYVEVTDHAQILRLLNRLDRLVKEKTLGGKMRTIGYPAGNISRSVHFATPQGPSSPWWYSGLDPKTRDRISLIGRGSHAAQTPLLIDLQFNFDATDFNRQKGGAFVMRRGHAYLAHRGIVTRGNSRVPKALLLQEADVTRVQAASEVRPFTADLLLVAALDSSTLMADIGEFSAEMRRAANEVMLPQYVHPPLGMKAPMPTGGRSPFDVTLSDYFDEFAGKTTSKRKVRVAMEWRHGHVVKALRNVLQNRGDVRKSIEMDLVVLKSNGEIDLYEVKTGADSQSIYSAIGQLVFHGAVLARLFPGKHIRRHLVLPLKLDKARRQAFCKQLGFEIVTFDMQASDVLFDGL